MRPPAPTSGRALRALRGLRGLPLSVRLAARGIARRPARSLTTSVGVAAALTLVLTTSGTVESLERAIRVQAEDAWRYDLRADLLAPMPADDLRARVAAVDGVRDVELALTLPVRVTGEVSKDGVAQGLAPGARLLRSVDFDGREQLPADGAIVLPAALAKDIHAAPGDTVTVQVLPGGAPRRVRVDGIAEAAIGGTAVLRRADLAQLAGLGDEANTAIVTVAPDRLRAARDALYEVDGALRVQDVRSLRALIEQSMGLIWAFVGSMLGASVILAAAVLYDTASLSILERRRELATLRALGQPMRDITWTITLEHATLAAFGLLLGLPAGWQATRSVCALYSGDLVQLPFVLTFRTIGVAVVGVVLVLLLAQAPALRVIARMNLADAVRSREG